MLKKLCGCKKRHFGIDIGTGSIKLVEVGGRGGKPSLEVLASTALPQDMYQDGYKGNQQALSDAIRELAVKSGISTPYCVSSIEGQNVFNRFIRFPVMSKEEVLEAVKWDAEKYLPYAPEDCYMDAVILAGEPGAREMKVLLVATGREVVDVHVELLCKADLQPVAIDFGALALGRAVLDRQMQSHSVILDMGAGSSKMTFFKGPAITLSRTIPFGGNHITRVLQEERGLSWKEAEDFKIRQKELLIPLEGETEGLERARSLIHLIIKDLQREINRSLAYYQRQNQDDVLSEMIFTGGGSLLSGLPEMLLADLDLRHVTVDLTRNFDGGSVFDKRLLQSVSPLFGTALGLALWEENI